MFVFLKRVWDELRETRGTRRKLEGDAEGAIQRVGRRCLCRKAEKDWGTFSITQTKALGKHFKMVEWNKVLAGRGLSWREGVSEGVFGGVFLAEFIQLDLVKFISGIRNWKVGCNRIFK